MSNKVEISIREYEELKNSEKTLNALQIAGVHNWDFYDAALTELRHEQSKDKCVGDFASEVIEFLCSNADIAERRYTGESAISLDYSNNKLFKEMLVGFVEKYNNENGGR